MPWVLYMIVAIGGSAPPQAPNALMAASPIEVGKFVKFDDCKNAANSSAGIVAGTPGSVASVHYVCVLSY